MAQVIDKLPPRERARGGRPSKYPYDEWLDGRPWVLLHGEDFRCGTRSMEGILRRQARLRHGTLETRTLREGEEKIGLAVQFTPFPEIWGAQP
jgi:hypothetical protein